MQEPNYLSLNGKVVSWAEGHIHLWTETAQRGMNVFDALRGFYDAERGLFRILCLDDHLTRLLRSAQALGFPQIVNVTTLRRCLADLLRSLHMKEHVYIRPTIFVEKGGYESEPSRMKTGYYIVVVPISSNLDQIKSQTAAISRYRKVPSTSFPAGIKAGAMYGLTRLARLDAQHQGADEALLLNETGHLTETPGANIFVVTQGRLYTPPISDGILDGVTRRNLLSLAQHHLCLDVHEQSITPEQVYGSSEAFVCGTLSQITGLSVVSRHPIPRSPGPIALELARLYYGICHGPQGINHDWITEFDLTSGRFV